MCFGVIVCVYIDPLHAHLTLAHPPHPLNT